DEVVTAPFVPAWCRSLSDCFSRATKSFAPARITLSDCGRVPHVTAADFRRIALSFDGAVERSHMGATDFRVGGHIFATLASVKDGFGNLMLTPEVQAQF